MLVVKSLSGLKNGRITCKVWLIFLKAKKVFLLQYNVLYLVQCSVTESYLETTQLTKSCCCCRGSLKPLYKNPDGLLRKIRSELIFDSRSTDNSNNSNLSVTELIDINILDIKP